MVEMLASKWKIKIGEALWVEEAAAPRAGRSRGLGLATSTIAISPGLGKARDYE
jgi:hypothetical protein